ncbi:MAG: DOMON domain-containing protein [Vulcanimicrobiaceae bacterium]
MAGKFDMLRLLVRTAVLCGVLVFALPAASTAADPSTPTAFAGSAHIPRVAEPPVLESGLADPAWKAAVQIPVDYDMRTRRLDPKASTAYALISGKHLFVAFRATQHARIVADERQDNVGLGNDDGVIVYLYPDGPSGFTYAFIVNPLGFHTAFSSENTAYAPAWKSSGKITPDGYTVAMEIPLDAIKGGKNGVWRANFRRVESQTLDDYVWSYAPNAVAGSDPPAVDAGTISGLPVASSAVRPQPRIGIYGLGAIASKSAGGDTSRAGADLSIPITRTTSFVSTIHPDYSNVEIDQQTISPTAFPRYFSDVRPFFTQLQNYYNNFSCFSCQGTQALYTTAIPTPRYGNAIEGKQGMFSFAGFDAVGAGRDDNAQSLSLQSRDQRLSASLQQNATSVDGLVDHVDTAGASYDSQKGLAFEAIDSQERGTLVNTASQGQWLSAGVGFYDKTQGLYSSWQRTGSEYNPIDGYVANNNIAGYSSNYSKVWYRAKDALIPRVLFYAQTDLFHNPDGRVGQSDDQVAVGIDLNHALGSKRLMHLRGQIGSSYVRLSDGVLVPVTQNGLDFTYGYRTGTPIDVTYYTGRFGPGTLDYWTRQFNALIAKKITLTLEDDDGDQRLDNGMRQTQWLERGSLTWQESGNRSLSLGVRRIIGPGPILDFSMPPPPTLNNWNLSAAYYQRWPHDELYIVYGDASQLSTVPQFVVKIIHYVGAEKGV